MHLVPFKHETSQVSGRERDSKDNTGGPQVKNKGERIF